MLNISRKFDYKKEEKQDTFPPLSHEISTEIEINRGNKRVKSAFR
jgi:hypothetical protein